MDTDVEAGQNATGIKQSKSDVHLQHLKTRSRAYLESHGSQIHHNGSSRNRCIDKFRNALERKMKLAGEKQEDLRANRNALETTRDAMMQQFDCDYSFSEHDPTASAKGYIRYLYRTSDDEPEWKTDEKEYFISTLLSDKKCLEDDLKRFKSNVSQDGYEWRWIHLPGNNMEWVEQTMLRVVEDFVRRRSKPESVSDSSMVQVVDHILHPRRWTARQVDRSPDMIHARSMDPLAQHFTVASKKTAPEFATFDQRSFVLFMPFLSWERSTVVAYRNIVCKEARDVARRLSSLPDEYVNIPSREAARETAKIQCCEREALLRNYLFAEKPLHLRRTLDQSYYTSLSDTKVRDEDQVAERHALRQKHWDPRERIDPCLLMVDQLWLWALERDTIITCFPRSWNHGDMDGFKGSDLFGQLRYRIERKCNDDKVEPGRVRIGKLISETCAQYLRTLSEISKCHQFMRFFDESLKQVKDEKSRIHRKISSELRNDSTDYDETFLKIDKEFRVLGEVMDITDEIVMILNVIDIQRQVLTKFEADFPRKRNEFRSAQRPKIEPGTDPGKQSPPKWEIFEKLETERKSWVALLKTANETRDEIKDLVELKQQHATIKLATDTSRQSKSILLFTLVTILFLPMSTLASIFGVNAADFGQGDVSLSRIFAYIFGTSGLVIFLTLWLAFNHTARNLLVLSLEVVLASFMVFIPSNIFDSTAQWLTTRLQVLRNRRKRKASSQKDGEQIGSNIGTGINFDELSYDGDIDDAETASNVS